MRILNMPALAPAALQKLIDEALAGVPQRPTARTRQWFRVRGDAAAPAETDPAQPATPPPAEDPASVVDIDIYAEIGSWYDGLTAKDFADALARLPEGTKTIRVHVNSPGGDVYDALAIANALQRHPASVEMLIEGIAASAATIITQGGGDKVKIADNALVMIHDPASYIGGGTAKDFRGYADMLDRVKAAIVTTYQRLSTVGADALAAMMDAATWMDAGEALANGFATEIVSGGPRVTASISPRATAALAVPEKYKASFEAALSRPTNDMTIKAGAKGTSIEEFCQAVCAALRAKLGDPWAADSASHWYVVQTYQDAVVINQDGETYEYPIAVAGDGDEVTLGEPVEVEMVWVPAEDSDGGPVGATLTTKARAAAAIKVGASAPPTPPANGAPAAPPVAAAATDVIRLCAEAGLDLAFAQSLVTAAVTAAELGARVKAEKDARAAATARATEITALCAHAQLPELAADYIAGGMPPASVRAQLVTLTAKLDKVEIDAGLTPDDHGTRREPVIDVRAVYAERNKPRP